MLADVDKFDGTKWASFKPKYTANANAPTGTVAGTVAPAAVTIPLPPDPTPMYSRTPSFEEWHHRDGLATSLLTLNVKDPVGIGLKTDGTAREAWLSLESVYGRVSCCRYADVRACGYHAHA